VERKHRADRQREYSTGLICSILANTNRDSKKRPMPYKPEDFMPSEFKQKEEQTPQDQFDICKNICKELGGTIVYEQKGAKPWKSET
jgi:hypothetical protein